MLRTILTLAALLATAVLTGVTAAAGPRDTAVGSPASSAAVRLVECVRGPGAENRLAVFRGAMRRQPGSVAMWMRFRLQERVGDGRFRIVKVPGLGGWHKSRPGVRRFAHRQRVLGLAEGSSYRAIVTFRWYDEGEALLRQTRRRSPVCRQPGLLANLRLSRIGGGHPVEGVPGAYRYAVHLVNRGRVPAQDFDVSFAVDGETAGVRNVNALAPGESRRLFFTGPACGRTVTAVADRGDRVRELSERDNTLTAPCPLAP